MYVTNWKSWINTSAKKNSPYWTKYGLVLQFLQKIAFIVGGREQDTKEEFENIDHLHLQDNKEATKHSKK